MEKPTEIASFLGGAPMVLRDGERLIDGTGDVWSVAFTTLDPVGGWWNVALMAQDGTVIESTVGEVLDLLHNRALRRVERRSEMSAFVLNDDHRSLLVAAAMLPGRTIFY